MTENDGLGAFLRSKATEQVEIDWQARRDQWLRDIADLYAQVKAWLAPLENEGVVQYSTWSVPLQEDHIGSYQAAIRVDFENRVMSRKPKNSVTRAFRRMATRTGRQVRLEDILDVWAREIASAKADVSQLKGALGFRHWLAHGRWWVPKLGHRYDPAGLFLVIESLFTKTGLPQA